MSLSLSHSNIASFASLNGTVQFERLVHNKELVFFLVAKE